MKNTTQHTTQKHKQHEQIRTHKTQQQKQHHMKHTDTHKTQQQTTHMENTQNKNANTRKHKTA